jgi:molybdopterin-guanine dinucleotide biosynthesis protein A
LKTALVLVGGAARRVGGREKYFFAYRGKTFLERLLDALDTVVDEVLIIAKDASQCEQFMNLLNIRCVADIHPGRGPVGGLQTGVLHAQGDLLFVVACDMPCVQPAVVRRLFSLIDKYDAVVPCWDKDRLEPLHAVYRRTSLEKYFMSESSPSLRGVVRRLSTRYVPVESLRDLDPDLATFTNINHLEELEAMRKRERG